MQPVLWKMGLVSIAPSLKNAKFFKQDGLDARRKERMDLDLEVASKLA